MRRTLPEVTLLLAACGGEDGGITPPPLPPPPPAPPTAVTATVGTGGATVTGPGGIVLVVPPEALATATAITISEVTAGAEPAPPPGGSLVGKAYALTPHGLAFGVPVSVTMPPGSAGIGARMLKIDPGAGPWEQVDVEPGGAGVTGVITSFSVIGVYCCFPAPTLSGPEDITGVPEGGFWIFNVAVFGDAPFRYQWFRDGAFLIGETSRTILIDPVGIGDDGARYRVEVTDRNGLVATSREAVLGVAAAPPVVVVEPTDLQVLAGGSGTFSASTRSSIPQTFQWQRSDDAGQTWAVIPGATAASYTLINAHLTNDDRARFRLLARNSSSLGPQPTVTRSALLTVTGAPIAPTIVTDPAPVTVTTGASASFTVTAGGNSLDFQWERADPGGGFADIAGATSATYTISNVAAGDDGADFRVRVSNPSGTVTSAAARLTVRRAAIVALTRIGGGLGHTVALRGDGSLLSWGGNDYGELGDGSTTSRAGAGPVVGLACAVATMSIGVHHNVAICADGQVWTWGRNGRGELGQPGVFGSGLVPMPNDAGPARHAAASREGAGHTLAVLANNPLAVAWGDNQSGQLGNGTTVSTSTPSLIGSPGRIVRVAAGNGFSLALRDDGSVWAWGRNADGQLGNGTTAAALHPGPVPGLHGIVAIGAGAGFAMAIDRDGAVWTWGDNDTGQLGDGTRTDRPTPGRVTLPGPAIGVAAGRLHAVALLEDGGVWGWGGNGFGQLGGQSGFELSPRPLGGALAGGIIAIGAGSFHTLAVDSDFAVWGVGQNSTGQLGDGTTEIRRAPVRAINVNLR